jgi:Tol biopolymer transport system component
MKVSTLVILGILALLTVSCQTAASRAGSFLAEMSGRAGKTDTAVGPGRLAYIGGDGNVYVSSADLAQTLRLTKDATTSPEGMGRSYHRISWSPDGRLAFAAVERTLTDIRSQLYVARPGELPQQIAQSDEDFVIYVHWSPVSCPTRPDCWALAYLIEEGERIVLRLVELVGDQIETQVLGHGRPFFFSWSPDGRRLLSHTGGARRFNAEARLSLLNLDSGQGTTLSEPPGMFLAPSWSPTDDRWLSVVARDGDDRLQILGDRKPITLADPMNNFAAAAWSPDGRYTAYAVRNQYEAPYFGPIHVLDLTTGRSQQITSGSFQIQAFFWSPSGDRLAYLTRLNLPDTVKLQWRIYDLENDRDRGYTVFSPSYQMRFLVGSFDQYGQSHRLWSPDGRYLVYADRNEQRKEQIWLVDTHAERGADPLWVGEGSIGIWSWQ